MHLACRPLRFELHDIRMLTLPAIVHWDLNHFVVLKSLTSKGIVVHDPAVGVKTYSLAAASKHLTGVALELSPTEGFARKNEKRCLPSVLGAYQWLGTPLVQIFALSVILELLVIAAPFYLRLTIDEVVARGDVRLMLTLALGFGCSPRSMSRPCAAIAYRLGGAERGALPHGRPPVPPPGPLAARFSSRNGISAMCCRAFSRSSRSARAGRGTDPRRDRRDHGDRDIDDDFALERPAGLVAVVALRFMSCGSRPTGGSAA